MTDRSAEPVEAGSYTVPAPAPPVELRSARGRALARAYFFSNCWLFALGRLFRRGGFLIISKSEWGWWPHLMWSPDMRTLHQFEPTEKKRRRLLPPFIYRGYVKKTRL